MVSRRAFLKSSGLALFAVGVGGNPLFLNRLARAAAPAAVYGKKKLLVTIFQRGAMDGLMAVTPFEDTFYQQSRPRLAMTAAHSSDVPTLIDLDGRFGLHPALSPFKRLYDEQRLAIVHGVGSPDPTRSHFDAQDYMETGTPGRKGTSSGWLNRVAGTMGHDASPFRAVAMTAALPRSLYGDEPALAVANLEEFGVNVAYHQNLSQVAGQTFESLYERTSQELLHTTGSESFEAVKMLSKIDVKNYVPSSDVEYPHSPLGKGLRQVAQLIKADVGLQIAFAECGGWDTHVQEGTSNGTFARAAQDLARSIVAFWSDVERYQDEVVLMTMTEFGRTVHENGSGGTDHGRASCLFVVGNPVKGGRVHGEVLALAPENLEDGRDLPVTADFRSVFAEVAGRQFGIADDKQVFPDWQGDRLPIMKG